MGLPSQLRLAHLSFEKDNAFMSAQGESVGGMYAELKNVETKPKTNMVRRDNWGLSLDQMVRDNVQVSLKSSIRCIDGIMV